MVHKIKTRFIAEQVQDLKLVKGADIGGGDLVPSTNVALTEEAVRFVRETTLTLTDLVITITDAQAYGGTKICDLPDSNMVILGVEADLSIVKDGTGILTGELPGVAIGTAVASNAVLSAAMIDVMAEKALGSGLTVAYDQHTNGQSTPALSFPDDSASGALYLNAAVDPTGDGDLTVTGTITFYYIDTGNVTS